MIWDENVDLNDFTPKLRFYIKTSHTTASLTAVLSSSCFSKLSCWVSESLRSFFSHEFGWRPLQPINVPQLTGSLGGEFLGQISCSACSVEASTELMVRGVEGTEVERNPEEELDGRYVFFG